MIFQTVTALFRAQVYARPERVAIREGGRARTYAQLGQRVERLAAALAAQGVRRGDRMAVLSENRAEYAEVELAAAHLGAIAACQNWRQADPELAHCLRLVEPSVLFVSERYAPVARRIEHRCPWTVCFGDEYEGLLCAKAVPPVGEAEDGLIILYTSGTTGLPKAAVISHRAIIARTWTHAIDRPTTEDDAFVAWTPMFHMGATDFVLGTLMRGGTVIVVDGFDAPALARLVATEQLGWLHVMPGTTERLIAELRAVHPRSVRYCGVMPDLVPREMIAELTRLLNAPYPSTFGSTEGGSILSRSMIPVGEAPQRLSKRQSSLCDVRLADEQGNEIAGDGLPGELEVRGPGLFSGYWGAKSPALKDGWFATGDVFVRNADGSFDYVDRRTYLIKSGGENIYPAEIERVLLAQPGVKEAVVVRRADAAWGEVPVAFVVAAAGCVTGEQLIEACRGRIARYKVPKEVRFVSSADLPRSVSGKVRRQELEARLAGEPAARTL
ncbi:MAG: class I adenylate-forming enzyme family protein [Betaproteobacteria bacterium]